MQISPCNARSHTCSFARSDCTASLGAVSLDSSTTRSRGVVSAITNRGRLFWSDLFALVLAFVDIDWPASLLLLQLNPAKISDFAPNGAQNQLCSLDWLIVAAPFCRASNGSTILKRPLHTAQKIVLQGPLAITPAGANLDQQ